MSERAQIARETLGGNVMNETIRMQLSAFVDGELPESETELLLRRLGQDAVLRAEVAEFIEIGRSMRGEHSVPGVHGLRSRIAGAIDADTDIPVTIDEPVESRGYAKPVAGVAIAAAVAVVAIFGLQQTATVDSGATVAGSGAADTPATEYVVPPDDPELREFLRMHGEIRAEQGANGMNVRDVTFRIRSGEIEENASPDAESTGESTDPGTDQVTE